MLRGEVKPLAARRQEVKIRACQQHLAQPRSRHNEVLDVVDDEQHAPVPDVHREISAGSNGLRDGAGEQSRIVQRPQRAPEHTIRITVLNPHSRFYRKAGLSDAAGSSQRDQANARAPQQLAYLVQLSLASEERGRLGWQVRGMIGPGVPKSGIGRSVERPESGAREVAR